jgi:hypothetical protein
MIHQRDFQLEMCPSLQLISALSIFRRLLVCFLDGGALDAGFSEPVTEKYPRSPLLQHDCKLQLNI